MENFQQTYYNHGKCQELRNTIVLKKNMEFQLYMHKHNCNARDHVIKHGINMENITKNMVLV